MGTTRPEVLVVDDDPDVRHALRFLLEHEGYTVLEATNGKQALDRLRKSAVPDRVSVLTTGSGRCLEDRSTNRQERECRPQ